MQDKDQKEVDTILIKGFMLEQSLSKWKSNTRRGKELL